VITGNLISIGMLSAGKYQGSKEIDVSNCKKVAFLVSTIFGDPESGCVDTTSIYFDVWASLPVYDTVSDEPEFFYRHKRYELTPTDWDDSELGYCNISPVIDVEPFTKMRISVFSETAEDVSIHVRMQKVEEGI